MKRPIPGRLAALLAVVFVLFAATGSRAQAPTPAPGAATPGQVHWLTVDGIITHGTAEYIARGIAEAEAAGATAVVIELDTPGGAVDATRDIVKSQLNATIPVIVWVGPRGARAGSAGVFITLAGNVAAMAPGTNIGAAHPVNIGPGAPGVPPATPTPAGPAGAGGKDEEGGKSKGPADAFRFLSNDEHMARKIENDTVAWVEAIAQERGRNEEWARDAVIHSVSITSARALELDVIDLIAEDREALLDALDGRTVETASGPVTLSTTYVEVVEDPMRIRERIVSWIANPTLLSLLMMVVVIGFLVEFYNPGLIFPAAIAGLALLLLLVGRQAVPVNAFAFILLALGAVCFVLEVKVTSFGMLTVAGIAATILGLSLLIDEREFTVPISWSIVGPALGATVAIAASLAFLSARALRTPAFGPEQDLIGRIVTVARPLQPEGTVEVDGTYWTALAPRDVPTGATVRIVTVDGLTLHVEPADPPPAEEA